MCAPPCVCSPRSSPFASWVSELLRAVGSVTEASQPLASSASVVTRSPRAVSTMVVAFGRVDRQQRRVPAVAVVIDRRQPALRVVGEAAQHRAGERVERAYVAPVEVELVDPAAVGRRRSARRRS